MVAENLTPVIRFENVSKSYEGGGKKLLALEGIDCEIADREFISVLGPSGCGKSTLIRLLAGLLPYDQGTVAIRGDKVAGPRRDVGIVFQTSNLLPWLDVEANLRLGVEIRQGKAKADEIDLAALTQSLGLAGFEKSFPHQLSGGMRHRVAIGQALALSPDVLLMDEPFGALDALTRDQLNMELLRLWQRDSKTVLLITHSIAEAVLLSDRVLVMCGRPGRIVEQVTIDLPRPRDPATTRASKQFGDYVVRLSRLMGVN